MKSLWQVTQGKLDRSNVSPTQKDVKNRVNEFNISIITISNMDYASSGYQRTDGTSVNEFRLQRPSAGEASGKAA
jgi:hypothetical protein